MSPEEFEVKVAEMRSDLKRKQRSERRKLTAKQRTELEAIRDDAAGDEELEK